MKCLVKDVNRKVLFIADNLKVHHKKIVKEWLNLSKDEIEIFFMLPYSPKINPDEYLKQNVHNGIIPHTKEQIKSRNFYAWITGTQRKSHKFVQT